MIKYSDFAQPSKIESENMQIRKLLHIYIGKNLVKLEVL